MKEVRWEASQGQYLVFSDVTGNTQYRYIWEDGRVTPFRKPSNNTNGNSFDHQGRQLSGLGPVHLPLSGKTMGFGSYGNCLSGCQN